ncbi:P-loop containing nucleoside triphosphate hydrolase protein [Gigaspora margarita]|uniref:P-loop containing nucleoside triphosphate hydrolase protein n=1 Tax=Gigaspora margarita TaxID=4874 RepID=A0A8H4A1L2_GIGMA|nr:P-loop containing nucleoside triphosphate hydrolase protein [Gigaspora margarita]
MPPDEMPSMLVYIIQAHVSISRIEKFLKEPEIDHKCSIQNFDVPYIEFKSATFQWPDGEDSIDNSSVSVELTMQTPLNKFTLKNLNVSFPVNELSIICGPMGSGQTSLLMALLGEMECLDGRVFLPRMTTESSNKLGGAPSGVVYAAQTGNFTSSQTYAKVLCVCALDKDLEILEFGDQTEVGKSGDQKQHVAYPEQFTLKINNNDR